MENTLIEKMLTDAAVRREIVRESHLWFFHTYFAHYVQHETAPFQKEIISLSENDDIPISVIVAFRGSGKSTMMTLSYPIWAILGRQQKKFIIILSQTQKQAKQHFVNLKNELETNEVLRKDLGPFKDQSNEWGMNALVIPQYNARIIVASCEQSVRGMRHGPHRPDLIICDDVEDLQSNKTREGRDKTFQWFTSEIVPLGSEDTKIVVVGNLLHEDSLLMKLKAGIEEKKIYGQFREYPLVDEQDNILWKSRFPDLEAVDREKKKILSESSWQREYMLKIISDAERVVHPDWLHYYDTLPPEGDIQKAYISVDLAVSEKASADCTAIILATIYGKGDDIRVYINPQMTNARLTFPEGVDTIRAYASIFHPEKRRSLIVEDNGYQKAMIQQLRAHRLNVCPMKSKIDKRSRLAMTTEYIKSGKILFPLNGAEELITQMVGFGKEKHDDLVDAFSMMIIKIIERNNLQRKERKTIQFRTPSRGWGWGTSGIFD